EQRGLLEICQFVCVPVGFEVILDLLAIWRGPATLAEPVRALQLDGEIDGPAVAPPAGEKRRGEHQPGQNDEETSRHCRPPLGPATSASRPSAPSAPVPSGTPGAPRRGRPSGSPRCCRPSWRPRP